MKRIENPHQLSPRLHLTSFSLELYPQLCLQQIRFCYRVNDAERVLENRFTPHFNFNLVRNICLESEKVNEACDEQAGGLISTYRFPKLTLQIFILLLVVA
jgi:hypothetical protein